MKKTRTLGKKARKAREWWVVVNQDGNGSIDPCCEDLADFDTKEQAECHAEWADNEWPELARHVAIQVREVLPRRKKR